jgi:membrane-bound serine protease (ClpP class)
MGKRAQLLRSASEASHWFAQPRSWALVLAVFILAITAYAQTQPSTRPSTQPSKPELTGPQKAAVVVLQGEIDDYNRDMVMKRFADARSAGAKVVILSIDTYGGMVTSGLDISRFIKQQSDLHTVAIVQNKAISAGAMIAMSCDEIVMRPSAVIGDCAPIMIRTDGSMEPMPDTERGKMESPILADFRDSAERNNHNVLCAEAMVTLDRVVHYVQAPDSEERRFVNQADYDKLIDEGWKPVDGVPDPIDGPKSLLTVHADLAKKIGLSKGTENSAESFAESRSYDILQTFAPNAGEKMIQVLSSGWVRGLLVTIFTISLYIAISAPGHGAAEAIAVVSLGLLIGVPLLTGYAQWWEIVIIFAGLALLAFEIFVFPGHFVSGIVGALMVIGGLIMTFVPKEPTGLPGVMPSLNGTYAALERGLIFVVSGMACSLFLWLWLQRFLPKVPYFRRLVLNTAVGTTDHTTGAVLPSEGIWPKIGAAGKAITDLYPGGKAAFHDEALGDDRITQVISESGFIAAGSSVIVRESAGNRVVVRATA